MKIKKYVKEIKPHNLIYCKEQMHAMAFVLVLEMSRNDLSHVLLTISALKSKIARDETAFDFTINKKTLSR